MLNIEWLGTAAFRIQYKDWTALLDPFISRNPFSRPKVKISLETIAKDAHFIFISHGHFDHIGDIAKILNINPKIQVWGPPTAIASIERDIKKQNQLDLIRCLHCTTEGYIPTFHEEISAEASLSKHVHFDTKLILTTLLRIARFPEVKKWVYPELITHYRSGETISWLFNFNGYRLRFLGSAGPTKQILQDWSQEPLDCLLVPLQGNSKICEIGFNIAEVLNPRCIIPHHHDNFYPPISQTIDITKFKQNVKKLNIPITELKVLEKHQLYPVRLPTSPRNFARRTSGRRAGNIHSIR